MKTKGIGTLHIVGIVVVVLVIVAVAALFAMLPKEQVIIDNTAFIVGSFESQGYCSSQEYSRNLKTGQVIRIDVEVKIGGPVLVQVRNEDTGHAVWESSDVYTKMSHDLMMPSTGSHTFEIYSLDSFTEVKIKVTIIEQ